MPEWQVGYAKAQAEFGSLMAQLLTAMAEGRLALPPPCEGEEPEPEGKD